MAIVKLKRSAVPGKIPQVSDLALGELGVNTYDGKLYIQKDNGVQSVVEVGAHLIQGLMPFSVYDPSETGKVLSSVDADRVPWSGVQDKPSSFTPSAHGHDATEITTNASYQFVTSNQKTAWDGKQDAISDTTDLVFLNAEVNGNLTPAVTGVSDLGTALLHFNEAWIDILHAGSLPDMCVADILVESTVTQIDITDLDGNLHGGYWFEALTASASGYLQCFVNGDTTGTNYYCNVLDSYSATVSNTVANNAYVGQLTNGNVQGSIYLDGFGKFRVRSEQAGDYQNSNIAIYSMHKTATITNITSLSFRGVASNNIVAGSRFRLYRRR